MTDLDVMENVAALLLHCIVLHSQRDFQELPPERLQSVIFYQKLHCELNSLRIFGVQPNTMFDGSQFMQEFCVHTLEGLRVNIQDY
jgi:hypothetical protein